MTLWKNAAFCHHQILQVGFMGFWCSRATAGKGLQTRLQPGKPPRILRNGVYVYIYIYPLNRVITYLRYPFIRPIYKGYISFNSIYKDRSGPPYNALSVSLRLFHPEISRVISPYWWRGRGNVGPSCMAQQYAVNSQLGSDSSRSENLMSFPTHH